MIVVALHATFEKRENVAIIGVGSEGKSTAVVHKFLELRRMIQAKLIDSHFLLLALNVIIFFVFGTTWQTLPGQGAA